MLRKATTNPFGRGFVLRLSHAELALDLGRRITVTLQTENVERGLVVEKEGNQIFVLITDLKASFGIWFVGGGFRMILGQLAGSAGNSLFDHMAGVAFHDSIEVLEDADFAVPASASVQSLDDGVVEEVPGATTEFLNLVLAKLRAMARSLAWSACWRLSIASRASCGVANRVS